MPQKVLRFAGINRQVNEFQGSGACEELINIRPHSTGLKVIRKKKVTCHSANTMRSLVEHKFGANENLLAIREGSVSWIDASGAEKQTLLNGYDAENISCAGNAIVIKLSDGDQKVFKFLNGSYSEYSVSIPLINMSVQLNSFGAMESYTDPAPTNTLESVRATLSSAYSKFYNSYAHGLAGPIVVGCTFELEDGSEIWSSGFSIIDPTKDANFTKATYGDNTAKVYGAKEAVLSFTIDNYSNVTGVKNIKFYSSLPLQPYEADDSINTFATKEVSKTDMNIAGQNMYLQKTISFRRNGEFKLNTEYKLAANELMPVTAGAIYRTGDSVSYNNRFHFFNSSVEHPLQYMSYGMHSNWTLPNEDTYTDIRKARMSVVIDNGEQEILVKRNGSFNVIMGSKMDFVYPMGGIKKGYLEISDDDFKTSKWYMIEFSDSSSYNYSCALDYMISSSVSAPSYSKIEEAHGQSVLWKKEANAINVSAQFNPFVFPVEYSYSFGGEISDVATSYLPISSTQVGQYPLTVFTSYGVYALEQGSGSVLYSNIVPLQPLIITGKATSTPSGTFFVSSKGLYLLSGRDSVNLSYVLNGERELTLRDVDAFKKLCCTKNSRLIDFSDMLSGEDFEDFISDVTLAYDQLHNELYISSNSDTIPYSYVFNINTSAYHKATKKYMGYKNGTRYAIEVIGDTRNIVDLSVEETAEQPILLQSRPMSLEVLYTHIQRLMLLVDAKLTGEQNICFSVFGSDNLYDWKCIISSQKQKTVLRQIRTNRAAKSYKDYIILINGLVSTDTDLSDIIADYTVVNRRLG